MYVYNNWFIIIFIITILNNKYKLYEVLLDNYNEFGINIIFKIYWICLLYFVIISVYYNIIENNKQSSYK